MKNIFLLFIIPLILASCHQQGQGSGNVSAIGRDTFAPPPPPPITGNFKNGHYQYTRDTANKLDGKERILILQYTVFGCACAQWIETRIANKAPDSIIAHSYIFIEPADTSLTVPERFDFGKNTIRVKGQFYVHEDYPKGTPPDGEEDLRKARVFRYTQIKILDK